MYKLSYKWISKRSLNKFVAWRVMQFLLLVFWCNRKLIQIVVFKKYNHTLSYAGIPVRVATFTCGEDSATFERCPINSATNVPWLSISCAPWIHCMSGCLFPFCSSTTLGYCFKNGRWDSLPKHVTWILYASYLTSSNSSC